MTDIKNSEHNAFDAYNKRRLELTYGLIPEGEGRRALDFGCGTGVIAKHLAEHGYQVLAVDHDPQRLAIAKAENSHPQVEYRQLNFEDAEKELGQDYDLITCLEMISHLHEPQAFFQRLSQLMKPGGYLILSTPNRHSLEAWFATFYQFLYGRLWNALDPAHVKVYRWGEVKELLRMNDFKVETMTGYYYAFQLHLGWKLKTLFYRHRFSLPFLKDAYASWPMNRFGYKFILRARKQV